MRRTIPAPEPISVSGIVPGSEIIRRPLGTDPETEMAGRLHLLRTKRKTLARDNYAHMIDGPGFTLGRHLFCLYWAGYEIRLELAEIETPELALAWLAHFGSKRWPGMTPARIAALIRALDKRFNWGLST